MIKVFKPILVRCIYQEMILVLDIKFAVMLNKIVLITRFARRILQDQHAHFAIKMKHIIPKTKINV
jgi:hypothetical protein